MVSVPEDPQEKRRRITAHALQVLRETRAKIDPALLDHMKERLSAVAGLTPGAMADAQIAAPPPPRPQAAPHAPAPVSGVQPADRAETPAAAPVEKEMAAPQGLTRKGGLFENARKDTPKAAPVRQAKPAPEERDDGMEPVDRQKISRIVMKYMQLREDGKAKH